MRIEEIYKSSLTGNNRRKEERVIPKCEGTKQSELDFKTMLKQAEEMLAKRKQGKA